VNDRDPIASSTLAHLYVAQGHHRRARAMLSEVVTADPTDGHALVLLRRLSAVGEGTLRGEDEGDVVRWRWQRISTPMSVASGSGERLQGLQGLHLVVVCCADVGPQTRLRVTSTPCRQPMGQWAWPKPVPQGTVVASIGRVAGRGSDLGFVPLLVSEPIGWG
jgi:hypothetical protein